MVSKGQGRRARNGLRRRLTYLHFGIGTIAINLRGMDAVKAVESLLEIFLAPY